MAADRQPLIGPELASALEPLLERFAELVAVQLAERLAAPAAAQERLPTRRLITLDELVTQLPAGRKPETWKRWLYQRTRHQQVPGAVKIGGRLFFDAQITLPWLQTGCTVGSLDLRARQSLHVQRMSRRGTNKAG
jgi:hypothetical protein